MGTLKDIARQGKDRAVSLALEKLGQHYAGRFGKILNLRFDSKAGEIRLELLLRGEADPIEVHVKDYEITRSGDRHFIVFNDIDISREWMKALADQYVRAKPFEIPDRYLRMIEMIA